MGRGTLILVVGPSGAGKDTLIEGARASLAADPRFCFARRVITRPAAAGGEDHEPATPVSFAERRAAGGFLLHWHAHGLDYGLAATLADELAAGRHVIANVSRAVIAEAAARFSPVAVIEVTASPEVLAERLAGRGRESAADIAARLARAAAPTTPPQEVRHAVVVNDGSPQQGIAAFLAAVAACAQTEGPGVAARP